MAAKTVIATAIPAGASITGPISLGSGGLTAIGTIGAWSGNAMSFRASSDNGATYSDLYADGNEVVLIIGDGQIENIDVDLWAGITNFKIRSGTSASPVVQPVLAQIAVVGDFSGPVPPPVLIPIPALTLTGTGNGPYIGSDFPPTDPNAQRVYTMDFVNNLDILDRTTASFGGSPTLGDLVGITFSNISFADGDVSILRTVQAADTMASIAGTIAAGINGNPVLTGVGLFASANGAVITISQSPLAGTTMASLLVPWALLQNTGSQVGLPQATETILFAPGGFIGETILSATCDVVSFEGFIDAAPANRILSDATITGSKVSFLLGNFLAGVVYRVTFTATTFQQPDIVLYSHILCGLPQ